MVRDLRISAIAGLISICLAGHGVAQSLEDASAAYRRGDYASAIRFLKALADEGGGNGGAETLETSRA